MSNYKLSPEARAKKQSQDREYQRLNADRIRAEHRERYRIKQQGPLVSQERLRELLKYDEAKGVFTYLVARGRFKPGDVAGHISKSDGRVNINIDGRLYRAHRLAWLYMTGEWPQHEIDHKDTNPSNNAWGNLRDVLPVINKQNIKKAPIGKKYSNLLGAQWCTQRKKWKSSIKVHKKLKHLGFFDTDAQASAAYIAAKRQLHEGCTI